MRKNSVTFKIITGFALICAALTLGALPLRASTMGLKQNSLIEGNVIMLSDVFSGIAEDGDKALGPAPRPGHDMVLNARTLLRIALALDLPWRPVSSTETVVLRRAGNMIEPDAVKAALSNSMTTEGYPGRYNMALAAPLPEMVLPTDMDGTVEVVSLNVKPDKNWFEATLAAPSRENPLHSFHVTGALQPLTQVPVLVEPLNRGSIIGARDITYIEMRADMLKDNMIVNEDNLVGMTPRRLIAAGQPVNRVDVDAPRTVERGEMVTMVFQEGTLLLTAQGKALEHGAKGDHIRVVNTSSNQTIDAVVTGSNEVTVKQF